MERLIQPIRAEKEYKELFAELVSQSVSRKPLPALLTGLTDGARCAFYVAATLDWKKKKNAREPSAVKKTPRALPKTPARKSCRKSSNRQKKPPRPLPLRNMLRKRARLKKPRRRKRPCPASPIAPTVRVGPMTPTVTAKTIRRNKNGKNPDCNGQNR